jgi:universal stress protein A
MKIKPVENQGGVRVELGPQESQLPVNDANREFSLKEILVPVDFTECTDKALSYALPFARQFGAGLTLLHVVEPVIGASSEAVLVNVNSDEGAERELARMKARVEKQAKCQTILRKGNAASEIIGVASERNCDLIILSTHGRTGLDRLISGSTSEKVVRRAGCPILVVRPHEHDFVTDDRVRAAKDRPESRIEAEMTTGM